MPHKSDPNYHEGATLSLSPPVCAYSHVLFFFLINTLLVSLLSLSCGNTFLQSRWARALSLPTGPWWSSGWDSALSLLRPDFNLWPGNRNPASSRCRLRSPRITRMEQHCYPLKTGHIYGVSNFVTNSIILFPSLLITTP